MKPQFNLLDHPNAQEVLEDLVSQATQKRERRADEERRQLREKREQILDELSVGTESLNCTVKQRREELCEAKKEVQRKSRALADARRQIDDFRRPLLQKLGKIEVEIARRPLEITGRLYRKYCEIVKALGCSPTPALDGKSYDRVCYSRADSLGRLAREIQELDDAGDLSKALLLERSIRSRLDSVMQN